MKFWLEDERVLKRKTCNNHWLYNEINAFASFCKGRKIDAKRNSKVMFLALFSYYWRHGFDCVGVRRRFKRDRKNDGFWVGKKIVQISITTVAAQRTDTRRKTDLDWCIWTRDATPVRGKGNGGEEPPPPSRGRGLKPDKTPKPPQPIGLVGLL